MPPHEERVRAFAHARRAVVVAPAGCGKTELIADAVAERSAERHLVLTHTHAGVRALRARMRRKGIAAASVHVDTIAGWALRTAAAFPATSGLSVSKTPTGEEWQRVYAAAARLLGAASGRRLLRNSYASVFIDEYQDCTLGQHALVLMLAEALPCRLVGDPLQAIFGFAGERPVDWQADVFGHFERQPKLETPHRWAGRNEALGYWLLKIRGPLSRGESIDLKSAGRALQWRPGGHGAQRDACYELLGREGRSVVLHKWAKGCHKLGRTLQGHFPVMEEMACEDLLRACAALDAARGGARALAVLEFAKTCLTEVGTTFKKLMEHLERGGGVGTSRMRTHPAVLEALRDVEGSVSPAPVRVALSALQNVPGAHLFRRELWAEMRRALERHELVQTACLADAAWQVRQVARHAGRAEAARALSRTLLVKGLEYEHTLVLDADALGACELYVALSRASTSLTVLSASTVLSPERHRAPTVASARPTRATATPGGR